MVKHSCTNIFAPLLGTKVNAAETVMSGANYFKNCQGGAWSKVIKGRVNVGSVNL